MTAPVFLDADLIAASVGSSLTLRGAEARHAVAVRRLRPGEIVHVVNGQGLRVCGTVTSADKSASELTIDIAEVHEEPTLEPRLILVQALAKSGRDEAAVEMACEVGVDAIIPWQANRSIVQWHGKKAIERQQRWQAIATGAAKQSRRSWVPRVHSMVTSSALADLIAAGGTWIVGHESATQPIAQIGLPPTGQVAVIIGPEGGIDDAELAALNAAGAEAALIGPHVMRSSTAGPIAIAHLASRAGRWAHHVG